MARHIARRRVGTTPRGVFDSGPQRLWDKSTVQRKSVGDALRTLRPLRLPRSIGGWISPPQVAAPKCAAASMIEPVPAKGSSMREPGRAWPMFADTSLRGVLGSVRFCTTTARHKPSPGRFGGVRKLCVHGRRA